MHAGFLPSLRWFGDMEVSRLCDHLMSHHAHHARKPLFSEGLVAMRWQFCLWEWRRGGGWMSRVKGCYPLQLCGVCRYLPRLLMDGNIWNRVNSSPKTRSSNTFWRAVLNSNWVSRFKFTKKLPLHQHTSQNQKKDRFIPFEIFLYPISASQASICFVFASIQSIQFQGMSKRKTLRL